MNLNDWILAQDKKVVKLNGGNEAYYGAIGGGFTTYYRINGKGGFVQNAITKDIFEFDDNELIYESLDVDTKKKVDEFCAKNPGQCYLASTYTSLGQIISVYDHELVANECLTDFSDW